MCKSVLNMWSLPCDSILGPKCDRDLTDDNFLNVVFADLWEFVAIRCSNINSQEQRESITDSNIGGCLFSSILPLTKCPVLQAVGTSAVPAPQRRMTFRGNKRWDGLIREMPVNGCEAFQRPPSLYRRRSGLLLTIDVHHLLNLSNKPLTLISFRENKCNHTNGNLQ